MNKSFNFRLLLLPFSWIYGGIVSLRNFFYDLGVLSSYAIPKKSICVGNLSTGGTGKTPHVDLITSYLIDHQKETSILSRGYGRSTFGLLEVKESSTASEVGDEPLFYKTKYGNKINVVVAEKRKLGVDYILDKYQKNEIIVLDDAFQHRAVKAGFNILITDYSYLFSDDYMLPAGNLREWTYGKKRANAIIVSKSPSEISENEMLIVKTKLKFNPEAIFFSYIEYGELKPFSKDVDFKIENILLITGIGNPSPLFKELDSRYHVELLRFKDHHIFTTKNIAEIHEKFDTFANGNKIIVTTEKDFMRLKNFIETNSASYPWFYQPINTVIKQQHKFNLCLNEYLKI
ncbi:MAG TPA: tetraacyldisaccharide 4'-kinase [Crocinitomicaceae bacterium]|nr:tetraacyldisaccharide 4'-kinase [Crocinitomicaceae bacterium]